MCNKVSKDFEPIPRRKGSQIAVLAGEIMMLVSSCCCLGAVGCLHGDCGQLAEAICSAHRVHRGTLDLIGVVYLYKFRVAIRDYPIPGRERHITYLFGTCSQNRPVLLLPG